MQNLGGNKKINQQNLQINWGMQRHYLVVYFSPSIPGLLSLTLGGRKNKRIELDDRKFTLGRIIKANLS